MHSTLVEFQCSLTTTSSMAFISSAWPLANLLRPSSTLNPQPDSFWLKYFGLNVQFIFLISNELAAYENQQHGKLFENSDPIKGITMYIIIALHIGVSMDFKSAFTLFHSLFGNTLCAGTRYSMCSTNTLYRNMYICALYVINNNFDVQNANKSSIKM